MKEFDSILFFWKNESEKSYKRRKSESFINNYKYYIASNKTRIKTN